MSLLVSGFLRVFFFSSLEQLGFFFCEVVIVEVRYIRVQKKMSTPQLVSELSLLLEDPTTFPEQLLVHRLDV